MYLPVIRNWCITHLHGKRHRTCPILVLWVGNIRRYLLPVYTTSYWPMITLLFRRYLSTGSGVGRSQGPTEPLAPSFQHRHLRRGAASSHAATVPGISAGVVDDLRRHSWGRRRRLDGGGGRVPHRRCSESSSVGEERKNIFFGRRKRPLLKGFESVGCSLSHFSPPQDINGCGVQTTAAVGVIHTPFITR